MESGTVSVVCDTACHSVSLLHESSALICVLFYSINLMLGRIPERFRKGDF